MKSMTIRGLNQDKVEEFHTCYESVDSEQYVLRKQITTKEPQGWQYHIFQMKAIFVTGKMPSSSSNTFEYVKKNPYSEWADKSAVN